MTTTLPNTKSVRFWRDPELPALEACEVAESLHSFPNHSHEDIYCFGLMIRGGSYCFGVNKEFVAPGEVALINPGQVHSGAPKGRTAKSYRMVYVQADWLRQAAAELGEFDAGIPEFYPMIVRDERLRRMLWRMSGTGLCRACRLEKETAMLETFSALLAGHGGVRAAVKRPGSEIPIVELAKEILAEDIGRKLTLDDLAREVGLSRRHLLRVFKARTGVPPHAFRTQRRIDAAKRMLKAGAPFAEVALAAGFNDQSHFTNTFKRYTAATPSQYAAS